MAFSKIPPNKPNTADSWQATSTHLPSWSPQCRLVLVPVDPSLQGEACLAGLGPYSLNLFILLAS